MQEASWEMSWELGMKTLKALPPTTWCKCGEGSWPGLTRGSIRSMTYDLGAAEAEHGWGGGGEGEGVPEHGCGGLAGR